MYKKGTFPPLSIIKIASTSVLESLKTVIEPCLRVDYHIFCIDASGIPHSEVCMGGVMN